MHRLLLLLLLLPPPLWLPPPPGRSRLLRPDLGLPDNRGRQRRSHCLTLSTARITTTAASSCCCWRGAGSAARMRSTPPSGAQGGRRPQRAGAPGPPPGRWAAGDRTRRRALLPSSREGERAALRRRRHRLLAAGGPGAAAERTLASPAPADHPTLGAHWSRLAPAEGAGGGLRRGDTEDGARGGRRAGGGGEGRRAVARAGIACGGAAHACARRGSCRAHVGGRGSARSRLSRPFRPPSPCVETRSVTGSIPLLAWGLPGSPRGNWGGGRHLGPLIPKGSERGCCRKQSH